MSDGEIELLDCPMDGEQPTYTYRDGMHWYGRGGTGWQMYVWALDDDTARQRWNSLCGGGK